MKAMASSAAVSVVPNLSLADASLELHDQVASKVIALTAGRGAEIRLLLPKGSRGNVDPVAAAFSAMTGVKIAVTETPVDEINTELTLDALSNSKSYDVALPATFGLPDLVSAGAILPITKFAQRHEPAGFRDDILFGTGDSFDDQIYGFQADGDAYLMFYNKAMLEDPEEGKRYEDKYSSPLRRPESWAELDRQMDFFNRPDEGKWGGLLFRTPGYLAWEWWVRFHSKGVWPFSDDLEPQIASEEGVAALDEMIAATKSLCPDVSHLGLFENWERFSRGDVYCNIGWGGSQKYLMSEKSPMRGNMAYGQTPGGMVDGRLLATPYFNWGWNYVVTSNTAQPELGYLFALFASSPVMSTLAVRQTDGFFDPYRPEHYDDLEIKAAYSEEFLNVHRSSLKSAIPDLYLRGQSAYFRVLSEWLVQALAGDIGTKQALERVAFRWRMISNSSGRTEQRARWTRLKQKYPKDVQGRMRNL